MKFQTSLAALVICSSAAVFAADNSRQSPPASEAARGAEPSNAQNADKPAGATRQTDSARTREANGSGKLSQKDRKFIEGAAQDGVAEVELAKIAQDRASSDEVKQFAAQLEQDHGKANEELKKIAEQKGISVPDTADHKHMREMKKLEKASGADFDRRYMAEMVKDHQKDLKTFNDEAKNAKDPEVKAFAEKTAQVIEQHLEMARKIAGEVGAKGADKSSALDAK